MIRVGHLMKSITVIFSLVNPMMAERVVGISQRDFLSRVFI